MAISSELEQLLAGWIPRQPWFPKLAADFGTDPDITPMSVARAFTYHAEELGGFTGLVAVISVGDGSTLRRLHVPLSLRGAEDIHLRHALIGTVDDLALGRVFVYDGPADPVFVNLVADAIVKRKVFDGGQLSTESLRHKSEREMRAAAGLGTESTAAQAQEPVAGAGAGKHAVDSVGAQAVEDIDIRPIEVVESRTGTSTVIIHDEYEPVELSFFRLLENGMPSSLTIPVLLTEAGSRSVPEVIGWSSGRWYDMFEVTEMEAPTALLSHVDVEAEPAWREAVDVVCAVDSGSIGGYNAQAAEMGKRIGELHTDMAAEFGITHSIGEPTKQLVQKWVSRVDWALGRAPLALDSLLPELRRHRARLLTLESVGGLQKIHGELTLDHVVSSPTDGYTVVKFTNSSDSDPKPVALDLVALLRSVDYAAGFARLQRTGELESDDGGLVVGGFGDDAAALREIYDSPEYLWASQVQNSLLSGYSRARGESVSLNNEVLRSALIDRLLVEVVTELRNRPNWLSVPLATLTWVLKGKPGRASDEAPGLVDVEDGDAEVGVDEAALGAVEPTGAETAGSEVVGSDTADSDVTAGSDTPADSDTTTDSDTAAGSNTPADSDVTADSDTTDSDTTDSDSADSESVDAELPGPESADAEAALQDTAGTAPKSATATEATGDTAADATEDDSAAEVMEADSAAEVERNAPLGEDTDSADEPAADPAADPAAERSSTTDSAASDDMADDEEVPFISPVPATFAARGAAPDARKPKKK